MSSFYSKSRYDFDDSSQSLLKDMTNNEDFQLFRKKESNLLHDDSIIIVRELNNIINMVKKNFLNDHDKLKLRFSLGTEGHNKENNFNVKNSEVSHVMKILSDLINNMGKAKLELENDIKKKDNQEMAEYEKELQK